MPVQPSYLTCTAAQASEFNKAHRHEYLSLNQLLECRAASHPDIRIAGFPELRNGRWELFELTFASLLSVSNTIALHLLKNTSLQARVPGDKSKRIVALLSPSCVELLVTLFAALRLGYGVLLLAPQNLAEANSHLCRVTEATHLICHSSLVQHGAQAAQGLMDTEIIEMPAREVWRSSPAAGPLIKVAMSPEEEMNLPALVMHTSGSTGMPKPIYQSHRVWTQAIPCMPGSPAFTTTPLFHGGSADFLRSINALSTLYLFSSLYPITVTNVVGAVEACHDATAFLSVPYILKMLAESTKGLEMLQRMDLVSTGGAPLPPSLGDDMVRHGVKLVSRLGSSECGFLMSSHRDYENDKEWSWLRNDNVCEDLLRFESVPDSADMYELIVGKEWSTRVVSNRDDGSFASGDLYSKHPAIAGAWRYAGRVDDMIVMTNGKKASANPIESALRACPEISEAIVFGASRPALGVIIVPAAVAVSEDVLARVHLVNQTLPTYASVQDELVIVLPPDADLPKTSKGSVVRPRALQQYADMIDKAYNRLEEGGEAIGFCEELQSEEQVKEFISSSVENVMKRHSRTVVKLPVRDDDDLFNAGVDSLQASVIQRTLQKAVGSEKILPSNVVFEYPSIVKLSKYIASVLFGSAPSITPSSDEDDHKVMRDLVARFTAPFTQVQGPAADDGIAIVTGATGSLGAHVLYKLLSTTRYRVVALLRATDNEEARRRVLQNLECRKLHIADADASRFVTFASNLEQDRLGLPQSTYETLLNGVQVIFHVGWPVNFAYSLESFVPILQGTQNLLTLASNAFAPARLIFCSSIAAASHSPPSSHPRFLITIHETLPTSESCAAPLGYARAKWVAEHMCDRASKTILPGGRVKVARIGQLCGDTEHGVWSESEAWSLLVASTKYTGCLPDFESRISLLPVDVAASALLDIASSQDGGNLIYHVTTPHPLPWPAFLAGLERAGLTYKRLPANAWVAMMESRNAELDMPTRSLLGLWTESFGRQDRVQSEPVYDTTYARDASEAMRTVQTVSDELIAKFVARWKESGFLSI